MDSEAAERKLEYLNNLFEMQGDYELFFVKGYDADSKKAIAGWSEWKQYSQATDSERLQANLRSVFKEEIVLDVEDPTRIEAINDELMKTPTNFITFETGSRGYHVHMIFPELKEIDNNQVTVIKERIIKHFGCDISKKSERNLIALEYDPHFKTGNIKKPIAIKTGQHNKLKIFLATTVKLKDLLSRDPKFNDVYSGQWAKWGFPTRSEAEQSLCGTLAKEGYDEEEIMNIMNSSKTGKWLEAHQSYRELTIRKAMEFAATQPKYIEELSLEPLFKWMEDYGEPKPVTWLVKNYIPSVGITIVAAHQASMKSFIVQDLIVAMLNHRKWLGNFDVLDDRPVILIDMENPHALIYERTTKLGGLPPKKLLVFDFEESFDVMNPTHAKQLMEMILMYDPCLIIFDTLRRTYSGDENDSQVINKVYRDVLKPASRERACIILAHKRKANKLAGQDDEMESIRGTGDITALCDSLIILRKNEDLTVTIKNKKQRSSTEAPTFTVKLNTENDKFKFEFLGNTQDFTSQEERISYRLAEWLRHNRTSDDIFKTKDMINAMAEEHFSETNIKYAIKILVVKGILEKLNRGFYKFTIAKKTLADFSSEVE